MSKLITWTNVFKDVHQRTPLYKNEGSSIRVSRPSIVETKRTNEGGDVWRPTNERTGFVLRDAARPPPAPWNKQLTSEGLTSQSEVSESGSRSPWLPVLLQVSYTAAVSVTSDGVCRHYIQYTLKEGLHSYTGGNRGLWTPSWLLLSSPIDVNHLFQIYKDKMVSSDLQWVREE